MIFEKWSLGLDVALLQEHLRDNVLNKPITHQSNSFGGWSVLSSTGDISDGWEQRHLLSKPEICEKIKNEIKSQIKNPSIKHTIKTEICTGYLDKVVDLLIQYNLNPYRARIIRLRAGTSSSWHADAPAHIYSVRLHIPIITNQKCLFETENESSHLAADGSAYFIFVNNIHRVVNWGPEDRYHLVMNVEDIGGISTFHSLQTFLNKQNP